MKVSSRCVPALLERERERELSNRFPCLSGPLDTMLRSLALGQACRYGNTDTIAEAQAQFAKHTSKTKPILADLRGVVYGCCMENGDEATFDQLMQVPSICAWNLVN